MNLHSATKDTAMQILVGALNFNEEITNTPEAVCDAWLLFAQPIVIRDADIINISQEGVFSGEQ